MEKIKKEYNKSQKKYNDFEKEYNNSKIKFAGSVTFGKAPQPKDLSIPKFIKNININEFIYSKIQ